MRVGAWPTDIEVMVILPVAALSVLFLRQPMLASESPCACESNAPWKMD